MPVRLFFMSIVDTGCLMETFFSPDVEMNVSCTAVSQALWVLRRLILHICTCCFRCWCCSWTCNRQAYFLPKRMWGCLAVSLNFSKLLSAGVHAESLVCWILAPGSFQNSSPHPLRSRLAQMFCLLVLSGSESLVCSSAIFTEQQT